MKKSEEETCITSNGNYMKVLKMKPGSQQPDGEAVVEVLSGGPARPGSGTLNGRFFDLKYGSFKLASEENLFGGDVGMVSTNRPALNEFLLRHSP